MAIMQEEAMASKEVAAGKRVVFRIAKDGINFLNLRMNRSVHIFKSLDEQQRFHKNLMLQTTVADRYRKLYQMQQMTKLLHPVTDKFRKILIRKWIS